MKKLFILGCICLTSVVHAQTFTYKPFKINASLGYAQATNRNQSGGIVISLEPKYALSNRTDLGLRLEEAVMVRGVVWSDNRNTSTGTATGFGSVLLTGTHYFSQTNTRPFLGVGVGYYSISSAGSVIVNNSSTRVELPLTSYSAIGGMFRAGLKTGHFVLSVEYNAIPKHTYGLSSSGNGTSSYQEFTTESSYAGFKLGFDFGGGPIH